MHETLTDVNIFIILISRLFFTNASKNRVLLDEKYLTQTSTLDQENIQKFEEKRLSFSSRAKTSLYNLFIT